jgi:hypothetical protein
MFVGEIGFPRKEFLYELKWWEVKSIIRGYNARHHHGWEQARLVAYNAHYCMGSKDPVPTVSEWIKFPWEQKKVTPLSKSDVEMMQAEIDAINAANAQKDK